LIYSRFIAGKNEDFLAKGDRVILQATTTAGLTLVSYDLRQFHHYYPNSEKQVFSHAGIIFIDYRSIPPDNFGGLVRSLIWLWEKTPER
jgi:hypothetical protein